jgi:hypothetical protein
MAQMVEHLCSKCEPLNSILSITKVTGRWGWGNKRQRQRDRENKLSQKNCWLNKVSLTETEFSWGVKWLKKEGQMEVKQKLVQMKSHTHTHTKIHTHTHTHTHTYIMDINWEEVNFQYVNVLGKWAFIGGNKIWPVTSGFTHNLFQIPHESKYNLIQY